MHGGKRWRMPVDDFAIPRGATEPVASKQTAEKVWEPKFLGEIVSGRDPRKPPIKQVAEGELTVANFLDRYYTNYVEAEGLKSADTVAGHIKGLKASLGELPVTVLEKPTDIGRFKAEYRKGHEAATVNRALGVLRARSIGDASRTHRCSRPHRSIVSVSASRPATKRNGTGAFTATRSRHSYRRHCR
jgi:hypothetical protein